MMVKPDTSCCPLCSHTGRRIMDFPDEICDERFALHTCSRCEVVYTHPFPKEELLNKIYSGEYWTRESTVEKKGRLARNIQALSNSRLALTIRPLLKRLPPGKSILEVGCGSGQLAVLLKNYGYEIEVTDISNSILQEVSSRHNIHGYCGDLVDIEFNRKYDAIIFNNVLEHLPNPAQDLKIASRLLTQRGIIFIEVPNIDSFQFKIFKASWFHLMIPQHLYHFAPNSLDTVLQRYDFRKIWLSTFSPRTSAAGYAASLSPELHPAQLRQTWSKPRIFIYLALQICAIPLVLVETLLGRGAVLRAMYQKPE